MGTHLGQNWGPFWRCQSVDKFCAKGSVSSKSQDYANSPKVSLQENWARLFQSTQSTC